MDAEGKLRLQRTEQRGGAGCGLEKAAAGEGASGFWVGIAAGHVVVLWCVRLNVRWRSACFPCARTKKAACLGHRVLPKAAALLFGPSLDLLGTATRWMPARNVPNSSSVPDQGQDK